MIRRAFRKRNHVEAVSVFTTSMTSRTFRLIMAAVFWGLVFQGPYGFSSCIAQENSHERIRVKPSATSARCGSAVNWRESLDAALAEAKESNRPVFFYVPTIPNSFMDRKPVIDRYMMAGPFSSPSLIELLNSHFVPVKEIPSKETSQRLGLEPYQFVEPGFLVLNQDGARLGEMDQLTTLQLDWLYHQIAAYVGDVKPTPSDNPELVNAWSQIKQGQMPEVLLELESNDPHAAEKLLLNGMMVFEQGDHERAQEIWATAAEIQPDHPLAWKAAAEAEGWGPYVRGFEVYRSLPESVLHRQPSNARGSAAGADVFSEDEIWRRSTDFLLRMQRQNGGWFDSDYDFGGTDGLPNVYVATSALCGWALLEARARIPERQSEIDDAITRAAKFVLQEEQLNRADRDEILWALAYRIRFLVKLIQTRPELREQYVQDLQRAVVDLENIQTKQGSWYHEYSNPFVTATALMTLKEATEVGMKLDSDKQERGVKALLRDRYQNGAFPYGTYDEDLSQANGDLDGAAGRLPLCELALWQWDQSDNQKLAFAIEYSLDHNQFLEASYKYDDHTSTHGYGGFFFWYDVRGRAEAILHLTDRSQRQTIARESKQWILQKPEIDGCFVDSHELGRSYGTAMALISLGLLDQAIAVE